ncbi:MAG: OB-fold domain-containing protein, partial [Candidatus Omnitrophota bacterium]
MIAHLQGTLRQKREDRVLVGMQGVVYEVLVPAVVMRAIEQDHLKEGDVISLVTYHYHQVEPSRSIPVLIGFLNEIEREFFEKFITVSGVGPKAAC